MLILTLSFFNLFSLGSVLSLSSIHKKKIQIEKHEHDKLFNVPRTISKKRKLDTTSEVRSTFPSLKVIKCIIHWHTCFLPREAMGCVQCSFTKVQNSLKTGQVQTPKCHEPKCKLVKPIVWAKLHWVRLMKNSACELGQCQTLNKKTFTLT